MSTVGQDSSFSKVTDCGLHSWSSLPVRDRILSLLPCPDWL